MHGDVCMVSRISTVMSLLTVISLWPGADHIPVTVDTGVIIVITHLNDNLTSMFTSSLFHGLSNSGVRERGHRKKDTHVSNVCVPHRDWAMCTRYICVALGYIWTTTLSLP